MHAALFRIEGGFLLRGRLWCPADAGMHSRQDGFVGNPSDDRGCAGIKDRKTRAAVTVERLKYFPWSGLGAYTGR